ncbi:hypothetical protein QQX98_010352 [Neonectria punicea]|uniref:Fork-head domain-containing protein n=1 Tax=Neonectria punicea TaxID=979145 RepID=A0ABR1GPU5_9HYPO
MDPPFPDGEQPSSYTNCLIPGTGQQSDCLSEFTAMDAYYTPSPTAEEESPHLSDAGSLPPASTLYQTQQHSLSTHSPSGLASMTSHPQYLPRSHQTWPSPPSGPEELDNYSYHSSPTCGSSQTGYDPSPVSPRTWPSPHHSFQHPTDSFPPQHHQQDPFSNVQIGTPTSTGSFPLCGSQVPTPYTGSLNRCFESDMDGLGRERSSPGGIPDFPVGTLSCAASPSEFPSDTSLYMAPTNKDHASQGESKTLPSSEVNLETKTKEASQPAPVPKVEEPYAQLICRAFRSRPDHTMTLQEIYQWFRENTDKAKSQSKGWQNSIRHNLSMNKAFMKRSPKKDSPAAALADDQPRMMAIQETKRSTEWVLADWAIKNGVQSTTRYRSNPARSRSHASKSTHAFQNEFQQSGNQISTTPVSGRRGGCMSSRARMRGRPYGHMTPLPSTHAHGIASVASVASTAAPTHHAMSVGSAIPHPIAIRRTMLPGMAMYPYGNGGDNMLVPRLDTPPQMGIKQEPSYSPLTPETTAPDSFGMMLPEPSLAHQGTTSAIQGATYALVSGSQGNQGPATNMYTGPSPCDFPYNLNDVSGIYQGDYPQSSEQVVSGGSECLFGPANGEGYQWHHEAL